MGVGEIRNAAVLALQTTFLGGVDDAVMRLLNVERVVTTGVGKSYVAALKFAATCNAFGVPAQPVHATELLHGELGAVTHRDGIVAFSYSGETSELHLVAIRRRFAVGVYGQRDCSLSLATDVSLIVNASDAASEHVPTASFIAQVMLGDELAHELARRRGATGLEETHPGGNLGRTRPWEC